MTKLFISDLDGTLTSKSLVLSHAGFLIELGVMEDNGSYKAWTQDMKNEALIVAVAEHYRHSITGMKVEHLLPKTFVQMFLKNEENWYSTLQYLLDQKQEGNEVMLVTGSSDFLVKELANALGFKHKATKYHTNKGILTGEIDGMFADFQKDNYIAKAVDKSKYSEIIGLGDTPSDIGIFKHCQKNILVAPTQYTLEKVLLSGVKIEQIVKA